MMDTKDPVIRLFGKKIVVPAEGEIRALTSEDSAESGVSTAHEDGTDQFRSTSSENCLEDSASEERETEKDSTAKKPNEPKEEDKPPTSIKEEATDTNKSQENTLKKPDKILPCPRCNSMETKFCYYNNYNVNQPRHFCKSCQRYWTAGGTMRNVPVGAGRRKNKNSTSHYRHITISEPLDEASKVITFGEEEKLFSRSNQNGFCKVGVNGGDFSSGSSVSSMDSGEKGGNNGFACQIPWPYSCYSSAVLPAVFPGLPLSFYPSAYWNYGSPVTSTITPFPDEKSNEKSNSSTLGKHLREDSESKVWVPKSLRIDDMGEAAKSSMWKTLGIKNDSIGFKAFKSKGGCEKTKLDSTSLLLQANPAAMCRSINFRECA